MKLDPETLKALKANNMTDAQLDEAIKFFHDLKDALDSLDSEWALVARVASQECWQLRNMKAVRSW